jgi:hypothetical protein
VEEGAEVVAVEMAAGGAARAVSVQLQLTDTRAESALHPLGSLHVLPGSHRPDTGRGLPGQIRSAVERFKESGGGRAPGGGGRGRGSGCDGGTSSGQWGASGHGAVVPVAVAAGTVTLYSSRLWHAGGANRRGAEDGGGEGEGRERAFVFLTLMEQLAAAPPGLIHTMARADVGRWVVSETGIRARLPVRRPEAQ